MSVSRNQDRRGPITPDRYAAIHQGFGWKVPKRFNMAQACCGQWAAQAATAELDAQRAAQLRRADEFEQQGIVA